MNALNLKFAGLGALTAIAVAAGTLAATSAPLHAAELVVTAKAPQARVAYDDLNLRSEAGVARLEARVRIAAETLCDVDGVRDLRSRLGRTDCRTAVIAAAAPQVKRAIEAYAERYAYAGAASGAGR